MWMGRRCTNEPTSARRIGRVSPGVVDGSIGHSHSSLAINSVAMAWHDFGRRTPNGIGKQATTTTTNSIEFSEWTERNGLDAINAHWMRLIALQFRRFGLTQKKFERGKNGTRLTNQNQVNLPSSSAASPISSFFVWRSTNESRNDEERGREKKRASERAREIGLRHRLRWIVALCSLHRLSGCVPLTRTCQRAEYNHK